MDVSEPGNSIYLQIGVWYDEGQNSIHITAKGVKGFHTTVTLNPNSLRGHPNLFTKLAKCLRDAGAPYPVIEKDNA